MRARNVVGYCITTRQIHGNNSGSIAARWPDNIHTPMYRYRKPGTIVGRVRFAFTFEPDDWRRVGILQRSLVHQLNYPYDGIYS
jgi:hypothetical protein